MKGLKADPSKDQNKFNDTYIEWFFVIVFILNSEQQTKFIFGLEFVHTVSLLVTTIAEFTNKKPNNLIFLK